MPFLKVSDDKIVRDPDSKQYDDSLKWWELGKEDAFKAVIQVTNSIEQDQYYWNEQLELYEKMYGDNRQRMGRVSSIDRFMAANDNNGQARLSLNVIQSCIDTLASKISSNKPKPQFVPNDGDWKQYSKAKRGTEFIEGIFDQCRVYPLAQRMFTDACIYGISGLYVNRKFGKLNVEYLTRDEVMVDALDGHNEEPTQLHLKRFVSRAKLMQLYPKFKEELRCIAPVASDGHSTLSGVSSISDRIVCVESWHLPTSSDSKDGRYCVTVENATLELSEYNHDKYPIVFFRPYHKPYDFWGRGIAETLFTLQLSINRLLMTIQDAQDFAVPRVFAENGSQVEAEHIDDQIGTVVWYSGTKPTIEANEVMPQSVYSWIQYLEEKAYQISGISVSSASGEKPKDVESRVAMETVADIEAGRFENMSISWNEFFVNLGEVIMFTAQDLYTSGKGKSLIAKLSKQNLVRVIDWKEMEFELDKFSIQLFPINRLPHDPAGREDTVTRWIQSGWVDEVHGMGLLDMPDLSEETSMMTGSLYLVRELIDRMLDNGDTDVHPIPQMDLALAMNETKLSIVNAVRRKYPEEHIQLVIGFFNECKEMQDMIAKQAQVQAQVQAQAAQQQAQAQAAPMPGTAPPLAQPAPTPTSPMLPNAPKQQ